MSKKLLPVVIADDTVDFDYDAPSHDAIHQILWGVPAGQLVAKEELKPATIGETADE